MLSGDLVYLRALEPSDATQMMIWENAMSNWRVSGTEVPYSLFAIKDFIEKNQSIRSSGQLRLIVCDKESEKSIGTLDLFEVNFKHGFASVGILIADECDRSKGYALDSLFILEKYAKEVLGLRNLMASMHEDNTASFKLFEKAGFEKIGIKKEWLSVGNKWVDELMMQLCLKEK